MKALYVTRLSKIRSGEYLLYSGSISDSMIVSAVNDSEIYVA